MDPQSKPDAAAAPTQVSDLPDDVVMPILRHLAPSDLARVAVQDKKLNHAATDDELWTTHAKKRWPDCTAKHYRNNWHQLYSQRMLLPDRFPAYVDRVALMTERAQTGPVRLNNSPTSSPVKRVPGSVHATAQLPLIRVPAMAFEELMRHVFDAGCAMASASSGGASSSSSSIAAMRRSPDFLLLQRCMVWWLDDKPELAVGFARSSAALLQAHDMWGAASGCVHWAEVPWRRSALQFLSELVECCAVHLSVTDRLAREAEQLDVLLRQLQREQHALGAGVKAPRGMPRYHWWFEHAPRQHS